MGRKLVFHRALFIPDERTNNERFVYYTSSNAKSNSIQQDMYKWGILHCSPVFANRSKAIKAKRSIVPWKGAVGWGWLMRVRKRNPAHTHIHTKRMIIVSQSSTFDVQCLAADYLVAVCGSELVVIRWAMSLSRPVETPSPMFKDISLQLCTTLYAITYTRANISSQKHNNKIIE